MKKYFLFFILLYLICPVSADISISHELSYTYIQWNWNNANPVDIYIDGELKAINTSIDYYLISGLNNEEKHFIYLIDNITPSNTGYDLIATSYIGLPLDELIILIFWFIILGVWIYYRHMFFGIINILLMLFMILNYGFIHGSNYAMIYAFLLIISIGMYFESKEGD